MSMISFKKSSPNSVLNKLWARFSRPSGPAADPAKGLEGASNPDQWPLAVSQETHAAVHEGGLTLLHVPSGRVFVCNRTAARIWQGASKGLSLDELSDEMSRQYRVARDVVRQDTRSLVSQMELHGLIIRGRL